ncbi:MAG: UDP-glucose/GDP-mannose dehydrogenase family protein [Calditrichaeota bacterium]|nr:MAG: UDP-glucose/GDP-mannose dehydrogenase family protein [Calditrichota bacterium]MBL1207699.1 UDP-glucose/GDP-mannose dehydrogenase family protein [Calditrichota bacterium]NOG47534.1 UDP-glucose/GDP-mannose dehydrogenase family protein [Calditrichota bacterium]
MKVAVVGTGYVGLVAGTCFSDTGNEVVCVDVDKEKIDGLKKGKVPIYEPGLEEMIKRNVREERLSFTTEIEAAVKSSQIIFIAVGTPPDEDGSADLQYVLAVAKSIGQNMNGFKVVVDKSTVPVGTAEKVTAEISKYTDLDFAVVSNPEFLKEGAAIADFMKPDRVVIGTSNEEAAEIMRNLYSPFVRTGKPIIVMDEKSAELTKYAANALLATKISFINEIANLCDTVGANVEMVRKGIGSDVRIGPYFIFPGTGYGGSCFPKDVKALIKTAGENGIDLNILKSVEEVNASQKTIMFNKIKEYFNGDLKGKKFAMWGLAFKPKTDDMREAPATEMIKALNEAGATVHAHDPEAMNEANRVYEDRLGKGVELFKKRYDALDGTDALIIMTEWNEFREPDFFLIKETLSSAAIFDGRNIYDPKRMKKYGIDYFSIGRPEKNN